MQYPIVQAPFKALILLEEEEEEEVEALCVYSGFQVTERKTSLYSEKLTTENSTKGNRRGKGVGERER